MTNIDMKIMDRRPMYCKECGGKLFYQNSGIYQCEDCGAEEYDDFGKIKNYLEIHGPSPAPYISEDTGVPLEIISVFLRNGRWRFRKAVNIISNVNDVVVHFATEDIVLDVQENLPDSYKVLYLNKWEKNQNKK